MSQRLIWNFEIESSKAITLPQVSASKAEFNNKRWEARFFWPDHQTILLQGMDDSFLELSRYAFKHRADRYLILNDRDYNIKIRRNQLLYKPKVEQTSKAIAYSKKIKYESINEMQLPTDEKLDLKSFLDCLNNDSQTIGVDKEAVIYKFDTTPKLTLELARLKINNQIFFSVSIESRVLLWVKYLSEHIIGNQLPCDYVQFLKSINSTKE